MNDQAGPGTASWGAGQRDPDVSVVVPVHSGLEAFDRCLDALHTQTLRPERFEVFVVANGVGGEAAARLEAVLARWAPHYGERLRVLRIEEASIARARNEGIANARGRIIVQLNEDSILSRTALAAHYAAHEGYGFDPRCVVAGGRRFPESYKTSLFNYLYEALWLYSPLHQSLPPFEADCMWFVTCNLSCTREAYVLFGAYDPAYVWGSDTGLGKRWESAHGVRVYVHTGIVSYHLHRLSFASWKENCVKRAPYVCRMQTGLFPEELRPEQRLAVKSRLDGMELDIAALDRDVQRLEEEFKGPERFEGCALLGRRIATLEELSLRLQPPLAAYHTRLEFGEIWRRAQGAASPQGPASARPQAAPVKVAAVAETTGAGVAANLRTAQAAGQPVAKAVGAEGSPKRPAVTVLLTNYLRPRNLAPILDCLQGQTVPVQVYVWNNQPGCPIPEHPLVKLTVTASRNMRCWPRWLMASMADTEYVCTLDDDLLFADQRVLEDAIAAAADRCPEGVVGFFGWQDVPGKGYRECRHINGSPEDCWVDFVKGRFMLLRRVLLERVPLAHPVFRDVESLLRRADDFYVNLCISQGRRGAHLVPGTLGRRYEELWDHGVGMMYEPGHREERGELVRRMFDYYASAGERAVPQGAAPPAGTGGPADVSRRPAAVRDGLRLVRRRLRQQAPANRVHLVYLSCEQHFEYLLTSLRSVERLGSECIGRVYLFIDKNHPLSERQAGVLEQELSLPLTVSLTDQPMSWGGPCVIANERVAFEKVAKQVAPDDYIAKVDSDLLFLSDRILHEVLASGAPMVGQPNLNGCFRYTQGGCYFLRVSFVPELLAQLPEEAIGTVARRLGHEKANCPEDAAIYTLARQATDRVAFRSFYLPLHKLGRISAADRDRFSVIHFEGCRREMLNVMARELLPEAFPTQAATAGRLATGTGP